LAKIIEDRKKAGRREEDALQYLLDQGQDVREVVSVSPERTTASVKLEFGSDTIYFSLRSAHCSRVRSTAASMPLGSQSTSALLSSGRIGFAPRWTVW
jgi:hypothetical protein